MEKNIGDHSRVDGRGSRSSARQDDHAQVRAYYDETWLDYCLLWLGHRDRAIHFGYWDENTHSHAQSLINTNRVLANRIGISPGQRILDAGCGVGGSTIWLAKTYDVEVVGITPVASQTTRAQQYARCQGVFDRVSFYLQDYTNTDFPDGSFDVIWAMESVCHAYNKRLFLAEARRLLRPGGRLGINEYMRYSRPYTISDESLLHSWLSGWAIPDLATGEEFIKWSEETGFSDIRLEDISPNVKPSLRRLYLLTTLLLPGALALRTLGLRSEVQQGNVRGARDQYRAFMRGLWFDGILTATAT